MNQSVSLLSINIDMGNKVMENLLGILSDRIYLFFGDLTLPLCDCSV